VLPELRAKAMPADNLGGARFVPNRSTHKSRTPARKFPEPFSAHASAASGDNSRSGASPGVLDNAAELVACAQLAIQVAENTLNVHKTGKSKYRQCRLI
jgi:hypothetical protein